MHEVSDRGLGCREMGGVGMGNRDQGRKNRRGKVNKYAVVKVRITGIGAKVRMRGVVVMVME